MKGKIKITDKKVYFEPKGLPEPKEEDYFIGSSFHQAYFNGAMEEYEASKQKVEVENVFRTECDAWTPIWVYDTMNIFDGKEVKDNQACKAEVIGKTATVIELTK